MLRSGSVMAHYLDDPQLTALVLFPEGWLLGSFDTPGNLRVVGRAKDTFIVGGFNAYPAEIEIALLRHPEIQEASVIGVPDQRLGEVGIAFVVLHRDSILRLLPHRWQNLLGEEPGGIRSMCLGLDRRQIQPDLREAQAGQRRHCFASFRNTSSTRCGTL